MINGKSSAIRVELSFLTVLLLTFAHPLIAQSAAELDWQETSAGQCKGEYVEPDIPVPAAPDQIHSRANSLLHVEGHSTTLNGDIEIQMDKQQIKGDFATIDAQTEIYTVEGSIEIREPGLVITGSSVQGNLFSGTAVIDSASFLMHQNRLRGSAATISRSEDNRLTIASGSFTTCEPMSNVWSVNGKSIELMTNEGYGVARDVTLRIKDLPVAYFPYFRFPIDDRRQSGFLVPSLGSDSDGGTDIAIPYYFNIAPNLDATYTLRSQWKRGIMHEGEVRHLSEHTENTIAGTYLKEDDEFDDRETIDVTNPGDLTEEDRWLVHVAHQGRMNRWSSRINYTSVSDIDYFRDFGGLIASNTTEFDQALGSNHSPALLRTGSLAYRGNILSSHLELRSFQTLSQTQVDQYETLPRLDVRADHSWSVFDANALVQYTDFDKDASRGIEPITGSRLVVDANLRAPLRKTWGYLTPGLRVIHREYDLDDVPLTARDDPGITTTSASLDAGLIFDRTVTIRGREMLQTLEPRFFYLYTEEDFQDDLPEFDTTRYSPSYSQLFRPNRFTGYDRIGDANQVSVGLTSRFYSPNSGAEMFTASIGQIFHFEDREVLLDPAYDPEASGSPIFTAITAKPSKNLRITASYEWDPDVNRSNRGYVFLRYRAHNDAIFNFHYAYTNEEVMLPGQFRNEEQSDVSFFWPVNHAWNVIGRWNYGWNLSQTIESLFGVEYNDCCWTARLVFRRHLDEPRFIRVTTPTGVFPQLDRRADSGIYFEFQLKGLASLGGRLDSLLRDSIAGYRSQ